MNTEQMLQRILEKQEAIETMLVAQAKTNKNYQWVEGYAVGSTENEGLSGKRSVYVLLYGPGEHMKDPMVKVYPGESRGLPAFIRNAVKWDRPDDYPTHSSMAAKKDNLQKKGKYIKCPMFSIVRWDGKETQMGPQKMLGGVVHWTQEAREAERKARSGQATQQAEPEPQEDERDDGTNPFTGEKIAAAPVSSPARDGLVAELWTLLPTVYKQWQRESEKLAEGVTVGRTSALKELDADELAKVRAIVLLEQAGKRIHGDDWYTVLGGLLGDHFYDSIYVASLANLQVLQSRLDLDALGNELYGGQWPAVRQHNFQRLTGGGRQPTADDYTKLIAGLRKLREQRVANGKVTA